MASIKRSRSEMLIADLVCFIGEVTRGSPWFGQE